ncbi:hypothetical protein HY086_05195 [Candidatus Gottesmanbacteria bacterium]|nr:hypothetical protein [Candidatus Gottesmanbacteria bacterium]
MEAPGENLQAHPTAQPSLTSDLPVVAKTPLADAKKPRTAVFGDLVVKEDLNHDLLTATEREIYQQGINTMQSLIAHADPADIQILTDPEMVSAIVGLQPLIHFANRHEAETIYRSFQKAGIHFGDNYSLLDWQLPALINDRASIQILKDVSSSAVELGLSLPAQIPGKQELLTYVVNVLNGPAPHDHLLYGLLSGYPPEDCVAWNKKQGAALGKNLPKVAVVSDIDGYFHYITKAVMPLEHNRSGPPSLIEEVVGRVQPLISNLERQIFTKSILSSFRSTETYIKAFGLKWKGTYPASPESILLCQKLLQIDREFHISETVNVAREKIDLAPAFWTFHSPGSARAMLKQIAGSFRPKK